MVMCNQRARNGRKEGGKKEGELVERKRRKDTCRATKNERQLGEGEIVVIMSASLAFQGRELEKKLETTHLAGWLCG